MTVTGRNDDVSILLPVDDAVGVVDTPTPPSAQISLQRLGLADALIGVPLNVFYEGVDSLQQLFVPRLPKTIIFPRFLFPQQPRQSTSISSCSVSLALPVSISWTI